MPLKISFMKKNVEQCGKMYNKNCVSHKRKSLKNIFKNKFCWENLRIEALVWTFGIGFGVIVEITDIKYGLLLKQFQRT